MRLYSLSFSVDDESDDLALEVLLAVTLALRERGQSGEVELHRATAPLATKVVE